MISRRTQQPLTPPRKPATSALLLALGVACSTGYAAAGPTATGATDGVVFENPSAGVTNITAPDRAIIDYASFNIAAGETVNFIQPDAASRVLNRIQGATPSRIDGTLTANGIVYLVNPAGVTFGAGSVVDVAGLYAAGASLSEDDFLAGSDRFTQVNGDITQQGVIRADTIAAFIGRDVVNTGTISVPNGTAVLASGDQVLIGSPRGGLMVQLDVTPRTDSGGVAQEGTIDARDVALAAGDLYSLAFTAGLATSGPGDAGFTLAEADTDGDGDIDNDDINTAIDNFTGPGGAGKDQSLGDVDGDGDVDDSDLGHLIALFTGPITPPVAPPPGPPIAGAFDLDTNDAVTRLPEVPVEVNLTEADLGILRDQLAIAARAPIAQERIEKAQARALYNDLSARGDQPVNPDGSITIANTRLDADVVREAIAVYRERLMVDGVTPAERSEQIRGALAQAYQGFSASGVPGEAYNPEGFVAYVQTNDPELLDDLGALQALRRLTTNMGLNDVEKDNSERAIVDRARPGVLTYEQMQATLEAAGGLSLAPADVDAG